MQAVSPQPAPLFNGRFARKLRYLLTLPIAAFVVVVLLFAIIASLYRGQHDGRIFAGVSMMGLDLSGMTPDEARSALTQAIPYTQEPAITFTYGSTNQTWQKSPLELGLSLDTNASVDAAMQVGRAGGPINQFREMFQGWYYGRTLPPTLLLDEGQLEAGLADIATELNKPAVSAALTIDGDTAVYTAGQVGQYLDIVEIRRLLAEPITSFRQAQVELNVQELVPAVYDDPDTARQIQQAVSAPINFYLQEPLADLDLNRVNLPQGELNNWLRFELVPDVDGSGHYEFFLDENAARQWLSQFAGQIDREPINARYYFDDDTRELVLVAPHVNGRKLDIEATLTQLKAQLSTPTRSVPFIVDEIVPAAHSGATAAELGITELIREQTTWFYGSSDARMHNIARSASNFYGIVIAPYEEFSFNKYLGSITEDDGYTEGLIIVGGQTIKGIGGGVCQVSTTMYQTAFWSGFPIVERWEHGYWLSYYNDGEGPGMDATVYSPIVDFRFVNNTPHHLLIENYYNEMNEALTFKFYSTSMGRTVEKEGPFFENVTEVPGPEEDRWEFDADVRAGTTEQIDWATEGADVTVHRIVKNADGEIIDDRFFESHYIPYPNTYHYGPDVEPFDYATVIDQDRP
jgi:vancomycin resistance protein YoaR